ncbi:hypothetical protein AcV7_006239 [Taiwanofungus camphoratus]|nr:hypothetical protein AcV7_006239 [Antrodia cinnamomea]
MVRFCTASIPPGRPEVSQIRSYTSAAQPGVSDPFSSLMAVSTTSWTVSLLASLGETSSHDGAVRMSEKMRLGEKKHSLASSAFPSNNSIARISNVFPDKCYPCDSDHEERKKCLHTLLSWLVRS